MPSCRMARSDRQPLTSKTITDIPTLRKKIAEAREAGYALTLEERLLGEIVLAAAITDRKGQVYLALG